MNMPLTGPRSPAFDRWYSHTQQVLLATLPTRPPDTAESSPWAIVEPQANLPKRVRVSVFNGYGMRKTLGRRKFRFSWEREVWWREFPSVREALGAAGRLGIPLTSGSGLR